MSVHGDPSPFLVIPLVFVAVIFVQWTLSKDYDFQCANCGHKFSPSLPLLILAPHNLGKKLLKCPACGHITWTKRVPKSGV